MRQIIGIILLLTIAAGMHSCTTTMFRKNYYAVNDLLHDTAGLKEKPWLKAHMRNGDIAILYNTWEVDSAQTQVTGNGALYDFNRNLITDGSLTIILSEVALFETNVAIPKNQNRLVAISIMTGIDVLFGVICITTPKACWGSCPTFYLDPSSNIHYADAESFSNAILPSMAYGDIDALSGEIAPGSNFELTLRNEALETHCIQQVSLYTVETPSGYSAFHTTDDRFVIANNTLIKGTAFGPEGDIGLLMSQADMQERFSASDEKDLNAREEIMLNFPTKDLQGEGGLVLHFRQTLLPTYCFYNAMSYMGDFVGGISTMLETDKNIQDKFHGDGVLGVLGGIDVYVLDPTTQDWVMKGTFNETGPIAINKQLLPIGNIAGTDSIQVKLVLNKGLWRIDMAALAYSLKPASTTQIQPTVITADDQLDNYATTALSDTTTTMITFPGEHYTLQFDIPEGTNPYTAFLYAKGYYLEYMRTDWLDDKDILKLRYMLNFPELYLKTEADDFKQYESMMEQIFWNSRISQPIFTDHVQE